MRLWKMEPVHTAPFVRLGLAASINPLVTLRSPPRNRTPLPLLTVYSLLSALQAGLEGNVIHFPAHPPASPSYFSPYSHSQVTSVAILCARARLCLHTHTINPLSKYNPLTFMAIMGRLIFLPLSPSFPSPPSVQIQLYSKSFGD